MIRQLYPLTGVRAYHMTGKRVIDSEMQFRKNGVNMGLPMLSEYEIWRTDVANIRAAKESSGGIIMAEPRVFLKENRAELKRTPGAGKKPAPGFCACRRKITEMYRGSGTCM